MTDHLKPHRARREETRSACFLLSTGEVQFREADSSPGVWIIEPPNTATVERYGRKRCLVTDRDELERWRHTATRTRGGRDRDFQRSKVYASDLDFSPIGDQSMRALTDWLGALLSKATFRRRWGAVELKVRDGRGQQRALGYGDARRAWISLPRWARSEGVALHELAHALTPRWEQHGRLFARTLLELFEVALGREARDELRDRFRKNGVKFNPRQPGRAGNPEALRAAAKPRPKPGPTE